MKKVKPQAHSESHKPHHKEPKEPIPVVVCEEFDYTEARHTAHKLRKLIGEILYVYPQTKCFGALCGFENSLLSAEKILGIVVPTYLNGEPRDPNGYQPESGAGGLTQYADAFHDMCKRDDRSNESLIGYGHEVWKLSEKLLDQMAIEPWDTLMGSTGTKNQGVKLFFVCTYKNENERILRFARLGRPSDPQTFQHCSREMMRRFHVDGWYKLDVHLQNLHECDHAEPYQIDEDPEFIKVSCRICGHECYFEKKGLHVCDVCASKMDRYAEVIQEMEAESEIENGWRSTKDAPRNTWILVAWAGGVDVAMFTKTDVKLESGYVMIEGWKTQTGVLLPSRPIAWQHFPLPPQD